MLILGKRRQEKMSEEIKRMLASIIYEHVKDPRIDLPSISITRVDVAQDISHARVYISIMGDEAKQTDTMQILQKAKGFIRSELAHGLQIRHAPELEFRLDKSIEQGIKISTLLESLSKETDPKEQLDE